MSSMGTRSAARRLATTAAFFVTACAAGVVPIWRLGANEFTGMLTLYSLAPIAIAGPLVTAGYALSEHDGFRYGHRITLFLLVAGNVTLFVSKTWEFVLMPEGCWSCEWPFPVARWLLVSTPIVMFGPLLRGVIARARRRTERR
jgi:hypothetical protein